MESLGLNRIGKVKADVVVGNINYARNGKWNY